MIEHGCLWLACRSLGGVTGCWFGAASATRRSSPTTCASRTEASLADLVYAAGMRWTIDDAIKAAKQETGLDEYEVRRWEDWYRHITLSLLAYAFLVVTRAAIWAGGSDPKGGREELLTVL